MTFSLVRRWLIGRPLDPLHQETRKRLALITLFAWIGLGADGLSSANYGPEAAFVTLGEHRELGFFLVLATAATVALIATAYTQVIELFPSGGGGYKVASQLLNPYAGVVTGAALIIDYVLTIAISIAAAVDALFSLLPATAEEARMPVGFGLLTLLVWLNLRGMKESIAVLAPIFFGFLLTHAAFIVVGLALRADTLITLTENSIGEATELGSSLGWLAVVTILVKAYAVGAGTYTGIEATSNNVHSLAEPRVRTGRRTMALMAASLATTAAGVMLLYLAWHAQPEAGQTLNASTFRQILDASWLGGTPVAPVVLTMTLGFAAALLLVAANTGFLGGPAVLANMAIDRWVPNAFADLSSRLVTKVGILVMGGAAAIIYQVTQANVRTLIILYSINVFLAFSLSLTGLARHRLRLSGPPTKLYKRIIPVAACAIAGLILVGLVIGEFHQGGWQAILITASLVLVCLMVRRHYRKVAAAHRRVDEELIRRGRANGDTATPPTDRLAKTAVFLVDHNLGAGMHTLLAVQRLFPGVFVNFVFVTVGEVDAHSYGGELALRQLKQEVGVRLAFFRGCCRGRGWPTAAYHSFGTNVVQELTTLCQQVRDDYPNAVFFATRVVLEPDNWVGRILHNRTAIALQRRLHLLGVPMMILPMLVDLSGRPAIGESLSATARAEQPGDPAPDQSPPSARRPHLVTEKTDEKVKRVANRERQAVAGPKRSSGI